MEVVYRPELDALYIRLRRQPAVDRTVRLGEDRHIDFAGSEPVGVEFRNVRRGVHADGLPEALTATAALATAFLQLALPETSVVEPRGQSAEPLRHEPSHPVVSATAGMFKTSRAASKTLDDLLREGRERRAHQIMRQS